VAQEAILSVQDLYTSIDTENGVVRAVDGVSFDLYPNEILGIVGESGCGKSMTALSILGLIPPRSARITSGHVMFEGRDLTRISKKEMRSVRGAEIAMIFQDALTALNPVHRVGVQISEMIRAHEKVSKSDANHRAVELLELVGIPNPGDRSRNYVHEFSGGMRQRAMIAMAMALDPKVLIADEPTTALDVTVQAQVMDVLQEVRERLNMAVILITHDLGLIAGMADRVMVMYAGRMVEQQDVYGIYEDPKHPYTWGLLSSMPRVDSDKSEDLYQIQGAPPNLIAPPSGCRFAPRCSLATDLCREEYPENREIGPAQFAACHYASEPDWSARMRGPAEVAT
jgi:peptide/nickel transport system ATP-binding protein